MSYNPNIFLKESKFVTIPAISSAHYYSFVDIDDCKHTIYSVKANSYALTITFSRPGNNYAGAYGKKATFINTGTNLIQIDFFGSGKHSSFNHPSGNIHLQANQYVTILFTDAGYAIIERSTISTT